MDCSEETVKKKYSGEVNEKPSIKLNNIAKRNPGVCKFFLSGRCWRNNDCKFLHNGVPAVSNVNLVGTSNQNLDILSNERTPSSESDEHNHSSNDEIYVNEHPKYSNKICKYYKAGYCRNSDCLFQHSYRFYNNFKQRHSGILQNEGYSTKTYVNRNSKQTKSVPLCKYYKRGLCRNGDQCKFYHPKSALPATDSEINSEECTEEKQQVKESNSSVNIPLQKETVVRAVIKSNQNIFELDSLSNEDISNIRNNEITQLKKRFVNHIVIEEDAIFKFEFQPSDPDWPFDMRSLQIEANFPQSYPIEVCEVEVLRNSENIPLVLVKYLNRSIVEWFEKRLEELKKNSKVEMMFRPFLKWFDKNLEELFIAGLKMVQRDMKAKEAGIEFVPPEALFKSNESQTAQDPCSLSDDEPTGVDTSVNVEMLRNETPKIPQQKGTTERQNNNSENQGTKILFSNLELTEGAAAMTCSKISVSLQCIRCKTLCNLNYVAKKNCCHRCTKCSKDIAFVFNPSTLHPYSNVLGTMILLNCKVVDINLVECYFLVDCLNCSKQVSLSGLHYSQTHKMWCLYCNQKLVICIGGVKFQASKESMFTGIKYIPAKKIAKQKDPVVKEGEPLPQFGTCKHYKKSFRWLRFPCCGRIYPCDLCHDEKEKDHEMKFASRMLCGFCAKEQQYNRDKPCTGCSSSMTKKSGSHWEGGKGCRNKIQMSREDKQKYAGTAKTISRKAQSTTVGKKA
ncbi:uncharacterized protein LOC129224392 [Uloborus diversus]|uniref:uncharacterized protein LOC129224392 n=1 Tax=Uloborus diversus TaxID=327109 RepID=UPI002408FFFE|nr:uncharacterized protein LOC129224392 [Uloborus diversus]